MQHRHSCVACVFCIGNHSKHKHEASARCNFLQRSDEILFTIKAENSSVTHIFTFQKNIPYIERIFSIPGSFNVTYAKMA